MEDFANLKWRQSEYIRLFENETHFIMEENIKDTLIFSPTFFEDFQKRENMLPQKKKNNKAVAPKSKIVPKKKKKKKARKKSTEETSNAVDINEEKTLEIPTEISCVNIEPYCPPKINVSDYNQELPSYGSITNEEIGSPAKIDGFNCYSQSEADKSPFSIQPYYPPKVTSNSIYNLELLNTNESDCSSTVTSKNINSSYNSDLIVNIEPYRPPKVNHNT